MVFCTAASLAPQPFGRMLANRDFEPRLAPHLGSLPLINLSRCSSAVDNMAAGMSICTGASLSRRHVRPYVHQQGILRLKPYFVYAFCCVEIPRGDSVAETFRYWGNPFSDADRSEEDAARHAVAKLRDEYAFDIKDANLENKKFYENLYARLSVDHTVVRDKYKRLKSDYNYIHSKAPLHPATPSSYRA